MTDAIEGSRARAVRDAAAAASEAPAPVKRTRAELSDDAARARAELAATLDAIEDKLNVPKQIGLAADRTTERVRDLAATNPVALAAIALGAAAVVGLGVWALVRKATGRF